MHEIWLDRLLQVDDGAVVFYRWTGVDDGREPVVLCDGIGCDGFIWRYITPVISRHRRVFHIHIRGHGRSPLPPDPERVSIEILADDVACMLDDAGVSSAILAGHSMGVQTCLEVYRRHESRVRAMVLTCGSYGSPLRTFYGTDVLHLVLPVVRLVAGAASWPLRFAWRRLLPTEVALRLSTLTEVNGDLIQHEDMMTYLDHLSRVDPVLFMRMLAYADRHSAADLLERIEVPVLLVEGDRDGFTPLALSREMEHRIPEATLLVVPGGTHAAPLERPDLVARGVEAFTQLL
jgi:pimeloyl-ACP methyl ester carboxylesterase